MLDMLKKYLGFNPAILIAVALFFSVCYKIYDVSYEAGYNKANNAWTKKAGEYKERIDTLYINNVNMSQRIDVLTTEDTSKRDETVKVITKKVIEYRDRPESKVKCLDDQFINTYNESLGVKE